MRRIDHLNKLLDLALQCVRDDCKGIGDYFISFFPGIDIFVIKKRYTLLRFHRGKGIRLIDTHGEEPSKGEIKALIEYLKNKLENCDEHS